MTKNTQTITPGKTTKRILAKGTSTLRVDSFQQECVSKTPPSYVTDADEPTVTIIPFSISGQLIPELWGGHEFMIRLMDLCGAVFLLLLSIPICIVAGGLIKFTSLGPIVYRQQRVGKNGKCFTLYKLRTMVDDAERIWGFKPASPGDVRITKVGSLLRRTRIDEIPQLINVIRGEMSLVGPRPENLYRVRLHKALRGVRLTVKPGITGLAQIRSLYDIKPEHKLKYDYLYIQNRSVWLNIYILFKTIPIMIKKSGW